MDHEPLCIVKSNKRDDILLFETWNFSSSKNLVREDKREFVGTWTNKYTNTHSNIHTQIHTYTYTHTNTHIEISTQPKNLHPEM